MFKRLPILALSCATLLLLPLLTPVARADDSKEYLVKAAFMYNFVKFVEWPGTHAVSKQNNINICVTGDNVLSSAAPVFKQASTPALSLSLVEENSIPDIIARCHILFISGSQSGRVQEITSALKSAPVLTVSDIDGFVDSGGMIGFVVVDNKIKLVVNTKTASAGGLKIDAQLLEIALKVIR